jgi:hypothetical protein
MITAGFANSGDDRGWYLIPVPPAWVMDEWEQQIEDDTLPRARAAEVADVEAFVDRHGLDALLAYVNDRLRRSAGSPGAPAETADRDDTPRLVLVKGTGHAA